MPGPRPSVHHQTGSGPDFFDYAEADMSYWDHRTPQYGALANEDHDII